ncbi:hypothetical protein [Methyloversatilis discipulorum]|uniref:hypothetical protein n=1 Tax=Methyloversatilis discipulorum TaxID=1119528 RepID=UPI003CC7DC2E
MRRKKDNPLADLRGYRMSRNENQTEFWGRFGVTQSAGSRYESGREVPAPLAMLVLAFAEGMLDDPAMARLQRLSATT